MNNTPNYDHFNRFYKANYIIFSNDCLNNKLNELLYEQFLDCYNQMRLSGDEIYVEPLPEIEREPFSKDFDVFGIFSDAYYICTNLLFSPNIYRHLPKEYYESEPDFNGWTQNIRDRYADAVVSMAYAILYSQSCLPTTAYRLMHFIEQRQKNDEYFFSQFKNMAEETFNTVEGTYDIDFLQFVQLKDDIVVNPMKVMRDNYLSELLDSAGSKDQKLRILITVKNMPEYNSDKYQNSIDEKIKLIREEKDFVKSIFFRDFCDEFYGISFDGKPLPPKAPDLASEFDELPFEAPPTLPEFQDAEKIEEEKNKLEHRIVDLEKELASMNSIFKEPELKPEAFTAQQCCLFFYYFFDKIGAEYKDMNRSAWKRLIWRVCNKTPKNIYDALRFDFDNEQTKKDLVVVAEAVKELFPEMASQILRDCEA